MPDARRMLAATVDRAVGLACVPPRLILARADALGLATPGLDLHERVTALGRHPVADLDRVAGPFVTAAVAATAGSGFACGAVGLRALGPVAAADAATSGLACVWATSAALQGYGFEVTTPAGQTALRAGLAAAAELGQPPPTTLALMFAVTQQVIATPAAESAVRTTAMAGVRRAATRGGNPRWLVAVPVASGGLNATLQARAVHRLAARALEAARDARLASAA